MDKTLVVIVGPTAVGKTSLSIQLAKHYNTEIISADSRQIFKEMSIGSAKPTQEEMAGITHHFIDTISIWEDHNAGKFEREAIIKIEDLFCIHDKVIMVGGSGLYIDAVCNGLDEVPPKDEQLREKLRIELKEKGIESLQEKLKTLDPEFYSTMDLNNSQRLIRALEVCIITGETYSGFRKNKGKIRNFNIIKIGLNIDREKLYERINLRVDQMVSQGLIDEVQQLLPYKQLNSLQTVGYRELFEFFDGEISSEKEAIEKIKMNTRRFAKRQLTWFKRDEKINWFKPDQFDNIITFLNSTK